jgi:hypothetical protein
MTKIVSTGLRTVRSNLSTVEAKVAYKAPPLAKPAAVTETRRSLGSGMAPRRALSDLTNPPSSLSRTLHQARLANEVYNDFSADKENSGSIAGWKDISRDPEQLKKYNLSPDDLLPDAKTGFRARMYVPMDGFPSSGMPPQLVFRGTEMKSGTDWKTNIRHGLGHSSEHHKMAAAIGRKIESSPDKIDLVGHSLGGGLATAAALTSGKPATIFNSAGFHNNVRQTLSDDGKPLHNGVKIEAFHVKGEILTSMQRKTGVMPQALGRSVAVAVPATHSRSSINVAKKAEGHFMTTMIQGLEAAEKNPGVLKVKDRHNSLPAFGHFSLPVDEVNQSLRSQAPVHMRKTQDRLSAEAGFILDYVKQHKEGIAPDDMKFNVSGDVRTEMMKNWGTVFLNNGDKAEVDSKLEELQKKASDIKDILPRPNPGLMKRGLSVLKPADASSSHDKSGLPTAARSA